MPVLATQRYAPENQEGRRCKFGKLEDDDDKSMIRADWNGELVHRDYGIHLGSSGCTICAPVGLALTNVDA
jgi:hypothetical protein